MLPPVAPEDNFGARPHASGPEVQAPLRPRITNIDLQSWGYTDGCLRCRQTRAGHILEGAKHPEQCRQ